MQISPQSGLASKDPDAPDILKNHFKQNGSAGSCAQSGCFTHFQPFSG
jgi:hypothetical protein